MRLDLAPVALDQFVRDTIAEIKVQIGPRLIKLNAEIPPKLQPLVTDAAKLKQVLINLLANALKFTEHGSVTVRITADHENRVTHIDVADTGIGISPDKLDTIFEAFHQAESGTARKYSGTGFGLTISRSLCKILGYILMLAAKWAKVRHSLFTFRPFHRCIGREVFRVRPREHENQREKNGFAN